MVTSSRKLQGKGFQTGTQACDGFGVLLVATLWTGEHIPFIMLVEFAPTPCLCFRALLDFFTRICHLHDSHLRKPKYRSLDRETATNQEISYCCATAIIRYHQNSREALAMALYHHLVIFVWYCCLGIRAVRLLGL